MVGDRDVKLLEGLLVVLIVVVAAGGLLAAAGVSIGTDGVETSTTVEAPLDPDAAAVRARGPLPAGVEITETHGAVRIERPDGVDRALFAIGTLPAVAVAMLVLVLLWRLVRSVRAGDPFVPVNARRLQIIGWSLVLWPFAAAIGGFAHVTLVDRNGAQDVALPQFELPLWPVAAGLVILVLSRVFAAGTRMRADVEGLV